MVKSGEKLFLFPGAGVISSYEDESGEYSEKLRYSAALDINGDGFPELQHQYLGRYSAGDSFSSYSSDGVVFCGGRAIGSD